MAEDYQERVRRGFEGQGFMSFLGAELEEVRQGHCRIRVPYSDSLTQQHGFFHGGVTATLADNASGFAAYSLMDESVQPLSVEFKISLVAPARGEFLEARATVKKSGGRLKFVQAEVYALHGRDETLVALALATITATRAVQEPVR